MSERITLFAEVLLPLPVPKAYTYRVPHEWNELLQVGQRVVVQFGARKVYSGIILRFTEDPPSLYNASYLLEIMDEEPIVQPLQLQFWQWISSYYMCHPGEVMAAALPAGFRLQSESLLVLHPEFDPENLPDLDEKESLIFNALLQKKELKTDAVAEMLGQKSGMRQIKSLYLKGIAVLKEEISERYKPKWEDIISLSPQWKDTSFATETLNQLEKRAPRQADAIMAVLGMGKGTVTKKELTEKHNIDSAQIKSLVQKGLLMLERRQVDRLKRLVTEPDELQLNAEQKVADNLVNTAFEEGKNVLLYGITGSGKTYLYIQQIKKALAAGKQALLLVPEVALTEQLVSRLEHYFGNEMGVWHNYYSGHERTELYEKVLKGEVRFIIGARSALFAPFSNLGIVVIDEEHENSFKQFDKRPHYHGRDAAIQLAYMHGCRVLAGSATPSYELWNLCTEGRWQKVTLNKRFTHTPAPQILLLNTAEGRKKNKPKGPFHSHMLEAIGECLEAKSQVIVYQNKKGFVPFIHCDMCGYTPHCVNCDITLTYYKSTGQQRCGYCAHAQPPMQLCPACGSTAVSMKGFGTERIAEELSLIFPAAKIARLDQESMRKRSDFQRVLNGFTNGEIDILVGTQLLSKGLDFQNVGLVAIPDADILLNIPDFRTHERAFQQMFQVAGRAGRGSKQGQVMIQSRQTAHPVLQAVLDNDYTGLTEQEIQVRKQFQYPPFSRIIKITVKHKDARKSEEASRYYAQMLRTTLKDRLMGPQAPLIGRVRNYYLQQIMVKMDKKKDDPAKVKELLWNASLKLITMPDFKGVWIDFDVDPA
ncbi:MAG: primosomal protein N' [Bacteroidetes bacterium]|nr:primosomal protein N' [Bacteroidota bacterium]